MHQNKQQQQIQQNHETHATLKSNRKLRSIKSQRYLNPLHHQQQPNQFRKQMDNKFIEVRLLAKQKNKLIDELNSLKEDAVCALQEKEEIIDRLRNYQSQMYFQDEKQQMQKQINKHIRKIKQLSQQKIYLADKCEKQRSFYFEQMCNKETIIEQLSARVASLELLSSDLTQQNKKLSLYNFQLEYSTNQMQEQLEKLREEILEYYNNVESKPKRESNLQRLSPINSEKHIPEKLSKLITHNPHPNIKQNQQHKSQTQTQTSIQTIKKQYQKQIQQIITFYEQQIKLIKTIYEKQNDNGYLKRTYETQNFSQKDQNQSVYDIYSLKSALMPKSRVNLRHQLKCTKYSSMNQQQKSQFSCKYFQYDSKTNLPNKDSLESTSKIEQMPSSPSKYKQKQKQKQKQGKLLKQSREYQMEQIQQNQQQIQTERIRNRISNREMLFCFGGGLFGTLFGITLHKLCTNIKN